jgi:cell division protease FtsH
MTTPTKQPPQPSGPAEAPPHQRPRSKSLERVMWVIAAVLLIWSLYPLFAPESPSAVALSYSDFLGQARAGVIATVTIKGQEISGKFREPVSWPPVAPSAPAGAGATPEAALQGKSRSYSTFTSVLPPFPDDQLLPLLDTRGVVLTIETTSGPSWLLQLAIYVVPVVLLIGALWFMGRRAQQGQRSMFGFGASHARKYDRQHPGVTFADVAGMDDAKAELMEVVAFLREPARFQKLGARLPHGVLLVGPPGTGKTLLARAVAGEAAVPFFSISASEFVEMFVGVGASRVRDVFEKAKQDAPAILFLDELDAVGRQRGTGLGGGNDEREQTLNQLLVEMDGFDENTNVIVLAATNRPDVLDPALLRPGRFDRQVTISLPDRAGREAILKVHTRRLPLGKDIDLAALARRTPGFSGADLANLANEAALAAARRNGQEVVVPDFDQALDQIVLGTRQATLLGEEEKRLVAYHESGHAVVAKLTPGSDPVARITIIPHGRALGITQQVAAEDRHNYTKEYLLGRLAVMLGGRAAEDTVFGQPTTGDESDLKEATALARRMVGQWGMSDELGPVAYRMGEMHPFLGRELAEPRDYAEATAADLDHAVRRLLEEAHQHARALLLEQRPVLDALVAELLLHESLDAGRLDALVQDYAGAPAAAR